MKLILIISLCLPSFAADWYVRSGASGNGTSWASAWSNTTGIVWASLNPGDTVWIAGGSYGALTVGKSGNADTAEGRIFVKRATVAAHGSDTGWSAEYDTQVSLASLTWDTLNVGSYVTVDGQADSGILIAHADSDSARSIDIQRGNSYITLRYLDVQGPGDSLSFSHAGDDRGIDITAWNGSAFEAVDYLLVQYLRVHGSCTQVFSFNSNYSTWEYSSFYNASMGTPSALCHPNIFATQASHDLTFRYNRVYNYDSEGIMIMGTNAISGGPHGSLYVYGNLWYGNLSSARAVEADDGPQGPLYFYNNTLSGLSLGVNTASPGSFVAGSIARNNIFWDMSEQTVADSNYNLCSGSCSGANSIASASNPFVNSATNDYRLASASVAAVGAGANLGSPFDYDFAGTARGSTFDIGAYEYAAPPPPTTLRNGTFTGVIR